MPADPKNDIPWSFLIQQIKDKEKKCIPFISNRVGNNYLFGEDVVAEWANKIGYPLADKGRLSSVAHFQSIMTGDESQTKFDYLKFLKEKLLSRAEQKAGHSPFLDSLRRDLPNLTVTKLAIKLGYCDFVAQPENPWTILAQLALPIYITTSFHGLLEIALEQMGRKPQSGIYGWSDLLRDNEFIVDINIKPTEQEPLVYHVYGSDEVSDSLILTDDNFFEFLENIAQDFDQPEPTKLGSIPRVVRSALSSKRWSLLLLGYNLYDWEFKMAFRSAIQSLKVLKRSMSLLIQFEPGAEHDRSTSINDAEIQKFLIKYADEHGFKVYLGDVQAFTERLWVEFNR